ncbi:ATP-dependent zinc metalloprotease FtsH [Leadbettera azotonutricia]|uniref:ATP-dependent zinc metalloprotease FtsH n=1 Tax=Leadbettera azotonutricia (strain ATCC BAA-888 / DSM 13862 / ZAS-9) TaxID=545695 RepID=F5Y7C7_LEAAZ|nr:ATP-dependent zinc metalloprotease FtsH [Leadbettera azotonutricia]AEF80954.1 cell division protease FtsH [Leadbettera azotonutricia ZAS-9]
MFDDQKDKIPPRLSPGKPNRFALVFFLAMVVLFIAYFFRNNDGPARQEIPYSEFTRSLELGELTAVTIHENNTIEGIRQVSGTRQNFKTLIPYQDPALLPMLREKGISVSGAVSQISPLRIFLEILPWIIGFGFIWFMFRNMQGSGNKAFQFGKSRAKRYHDEGRKITFADVAGQKDAKYELQEVVAFLKEPQKFTKMGARIPKGVLLVGMPGTGKTLMARAVAGEAGVAYFHMSGSDFVEMFVGVGASRVRDLFDQGRKSAPCIIFIDELDAVGRTRGAGYGGGHDEREQTLNQLLVEMDGFDSKDGVIILAATNRPDVLDPALLRPGRFDRQVVVAMPDIKEREDILKIHSAKIPLSAGVDLVRIARATPGMSGADIANLVNEAALFAARQDKKEVEMPDFEEARDKILMGVARTTLVISDKERRMTAVHEAGHALLHYFLKDADPLHKVTIVPHGRALGMAMSLPVEDSYSRTKGWIQDRIVICYGGWVSEKIFYDETTTGTKQDLEQATDMARRMVCEWGMADEMGPVTYGQEDEPIFLGKEIARHKDYSEDTAHRIDKAVKEILDAGRIKADDILRSNRDKLEKLSEALLVQETLIDDQIRSLLGFPPRETPASLATPSPASGA